MEKQKDRPAEQDQLIRSQDVEVAIPFKTPELTSAALESASQILSDHAAPTERREAGPETESLPVVQVPPIWPRVLMVFARIVLLPAVAVARLFAWLEERFSPHRPDASEVRMRATPKLQMDSRPPRKR